MRRRQASLELTLNDAEYQALKRIRRQPVDYREARLIVEDVSVRGTVDLPGACEVVVSLLLRVDETIEEVEPFFRSELEAATPPLV